MACSLKEAVEKAKAFKVGYDIWKAKDGGDYWVIYFKFPPDSTGDRDVLVYKESGKVTTLAPSEYIKWIDNPPKPVDITEYI